ncbi:MAG: ATP-binding cassette domain-containing protein [Pseudomonadota bacterium]
MSESSEALSITDLHKSFGDVKCLRGISTTAHTGDVISVLGASGSGKSTMLRCVNLLETPNAGSVKVHGEEIRMTTNKYGEPVPADNKQVERIRSKLGMVFQSFNLWTHMTVMENVTEALVHVLNQSKAEAHEKAQAVLHKVGMYDRRDYYPAHISGGQQQRAAIARVLAMEPELMLFDEPTSALDPELVGEVLRVMRNLAEEGRTMIVVTHEMGFARDVSNKVIFLENGVIDCEGAPSEMFGNPESERFRQFLSKSLH